MLRIVVSDDDRYELFPKVAKGDLALKQLGAFIVNTDSTKIYRVESESDIDDIEALKKLKADDGSGLELTNKVRRINLMDKANACFDQDSIFAVGEFMIQPPLQGFAISVGGVVWADVRGRRIALTICNMPFFAHRFKR